MYCNMAEVKSMLRERWRHTVPGAERFDSVHKLDKIHPVKMYNVSALLTARTQRIIEHHYRADFALCAWETYGPNALT